MIMIKEMVTPPSVEEFKTLLKKHDLKATRQRIAVHSAMLSLGHASAEMVKREIEEAGEEQITVASVYNTLAQLALLGIYQHRFSSNNIMYFDINTFRHIHLYNSEENTYKDVIDEDVIDYVSGWLSKRRFKGYTVDGFDIQIICRPTNRRLRHNKPTNKK